MKLNLDINLDDLLIKFKKIPATEKIFLLQNLSIMIKTGIPIADALGAIASQTKNKKLKKIISEIQGQIEKGESFGESLEPYQADFGQLFINMIKSGEASGQLEEVLSELYLQIKKEYEMMINIRNALTYPAIIVMAMIGIGTFIVFFVLPNITNLFTELDAELPLATRILINISNFTQNNGLLVGVAILIIAFSLIKFSQTKKGRQTTSVLILKLPIISPITKKINIARISRNLGSLITTDISIIEAVNITANILNNTVYRSALAQIGEKVKKGEKIAETMNNYQNIFPATVIQMISVGEETGALDEVLTKLADFYEESIAQTMKSLPTIIEPILMLLIGIAVAIVALAILMPMYSLTQNF